MFVTSDFSQAYREILAAIFCDEMFLSWPSARAAIEVAKDTLAASGIAGAEPKDICIDRCLMLIAGEKRKFDDEIVMQYSRELRRFWSEASDEHWDADDWTIDEQALTKKSFNTVKLPDADEANGDFGYVNRWATERGLSCRTYVFGRCNNGFKVDADFSVLREDHPVASFTASFLMSRPPWRPSEQENFTDWDSISLEMFALHDLVKSVLGAT